MRVMIFTNEDVHHKMLCRELSREFDVAAIVHPRPFDAGLNQSVRRLVRRMRARGLIHTTSTALARTRFGGWQPGEYRSRRARELWPSAERDYEALRQKVPVYRGVDVNSADGILLVKQIDPDVVVNLGGDIYRESIIRACRLMLNFHSGVSPLYNGTGTIEYAYSNGHFRMCGGTLMVMNCEIDGGDILAHVFPALRARDTPTDIFLRCVGMAPAVYASFLRNLQAGGSFRSVPQGRPMFLVRGTDWTLDRSLSTRRHLRRGVPAWAQREGRIVSYWQEFDKSAAHAAFEREILDLALSTPS
jgi:methionyl-tRNA formyltransferase